jgi:hypothetical protein
MADEHVDRRDKIVRWLTRVGAAALSVIVIPLLLARVARVSEDRKQEFDLKVKLVDDLTGSFTTTVIQADFFASRLVPAAASAAPPAGTTTYTAALSDWLIASSKLGSQINDYYLSVDECPSSLAEIFGSQREERVQCEWLPLFTAVTDYLRLSSNVETFDRAEAAGRIRSLVTQALPASSTDVQWDALGQTGTPDFYTAFRAVENLMLSVRDDYVNEVRHSHIKGFLNHFWTIG